MKSFRIAIDLDGVVINIHDQWFAKLSQEIGREIKREDIVRHNMESVLGVSTETVLKSYTPDLYATAPPVIGAIKGVQTLSSLTEFPLVVVSRSDLQFDAVKTDWLTRHLPGVNFDFRYVQYHEAKHPKLSDCDFFVDDYESNFVNVPVTCECILFDQPWNQHVTGFLRAKGWKEVIKQVTALAL